MTNLDAGTLCRTWTQGEGVGTARLAKQGRKLKMTHPPHPWYGIPPYLIPKSLRGSLIPFPYLVHTCSIPRHTSVPDNTAVTRCECLKQRIAAVISGQWSVIGSQRSRPCAVLENLDNDGGKTTVNYGQLSPFWRLFWSRLNKSKGVRVEKALQKVPKKLVI
jgi:hypothetical protein